MVTAAWNNAYIGGEKSQKAKTNNGNHNIGSATPLVHVTWYGLNRYRVRRIVLNTAKTPLAAWSGCVKCLSVGLRRGLELLTVRCAPLRATRRDVSPVPLAARHSLHLLLSALPWSPISKLLRGRAMWWPRRQTRSATDVLAWCQERSLGEHKLGMYQSKVCAARPSGQQRGLLFQCPSSQFWRTAVACDELKTGLNTQGFARGRIGKWTSWPERIPRTCADSASCTTRRAIDKVSSV